MKKHLFFILCLMALALNTLPVVANDYLTIHFKDGHTERHFMKLVESISTSKYDIEGNLHDDYQTQQLVINGTTYSYPLTYIDSISYHKVDEEQVKQNVNNIYSAAAPIFEQCSTIEEMEKHVDEIRKMEGVEDVQRSGTDIIVKVRGWYDIVFMYPVVSEDESQSLARKFDNSSLKSFTRQIQQTTADGKQLKVAIAHQMGDDPRFKYQKMDLEELRDEFEAMGYEVDFIPSEKGGNFDLDFYHRRMYDYNIVILHTHGGYNEETGVHSLLTDLYMPTNVTIWNGMDYLLDKFDLIDPITTDLGDTYIGLCRTGYIAWGTFIGVTENFIAKSKSKFAEGPHIVFNAACHSLGGEGTLKRKYKGKTNTFQGSDAFAEIFHKKGADVYLGYNNEAYKSGFAACNYFRHMLKGGSHEYAFDNIPENYADEQTEEKASLIDIVNPNSKEDIFIINNHTVEKSIQEINNEYKSNGKLKLKGVTYIYNMTDPIPCGFRLAKEPNVDKLEEDQYDEFKANNLSLSETGQPGQYDFSVDITPNVGTKVYYRALTYDGYHYNWGEEKTFVVKTLNLSSKILSMLTGWTITVDITSGNGDYTVKSNNNAVTATIDGETVIVNAISSGNAIITVTDNITGLTENINVSIEAIPNSNLITFKDKLVKEICVTNWDTNGDGELSTEEAAAVKSLGDVFRSKDITSFDELQQFTGLGKISEYAFYDCNKLSSITISNSVINIDNYAFGYCTRLNTITIPNNVTSIGHSAFSNSGLTSITIPNSVTSIGEDAFFRCGGLTSITIPQSVTSIGEYAFYACGNLESIDIPNKMTSIGEYAFALCGSLTSIIIPSSVIFIGSGAFYGSNLNTIEVDKDNTVYDSRDNSLSIIETKTNTLIVGCKNTSIPPSVTSIGEMALGGCKLTSVTIPNSVKVIGDKAFYNCCSLTSVTIPNSVTSIGSNAFQTCCILSSITIPNSVTYIGNKAFSGCDNLKDITCQATNVPTVEIDVLDGVNLSNATLRVPAGSVEKYAAVEPWKNFKEIVAIE